MKRFYIILAIACAISFLDSLGVKYDLEPGDPGYAKFGALGKICTLVVIPIVLLRIFTWVAIARIISPFPNPTLQFIDSHRYLFIYITDIILVVSLIEIFYGIFFALKKLNIKMLRNKITNRSNEATPR